MTFCLFVSARAVAVASSIGNKLMGGKLTSFAFKRLFDFWACLSVYCSLLHKICKLLSF